MFHSEKINTKRQVELDVARGIAVLFMIIIHAQLYFASTNTLDTYFADFNDFTGDIPAAPMFMFLLGIGINYTKKNDPKIMFKRGLGLIFTGYLLNFVRGFLPNIIQAYNLSNIAYIYTAVSELFYVDILHFSGITMIMFGVFKKFKIKNIKIALIGILLALINLFMLKIQTDNIIISAITGLFWGSNELTFFPFLTWMFYPIAGFIFGSFLIRCNDKNKFYAISGIVASIIFIGGTYLFNVIFKIPNGLTSDTGYYQHFLTDNITFTAFVIFEISILNFIVPIMPRFLKSMIERWSKNVTSIFCIHWVIITWSVLIIPSRSLNMFNFIIYLLVIISLSDFLAYYYLRLKLKLDRSIVIYVLIGSLVASMCSTVILPLLKLDEIYKAYYVEKLDMGDYEYTGMIDPFTGEPSGDGKATFINGNIYRGEFVNGEFNGEGILINSNGDIENGLWKDGELVSP